MDWQSYLNISEYKTSSAWVVVLGLGGVLLLLAFILYPHREALLSLQHTEIIIAAVALLVPWGMAAAVIVVRFIQLVLNLLQELGSNHLKAEELRRQKAVEILNLQKNIPTVTGLARDQLFWILRCSHDRVDQHVEFSLIEKGFLIPKARSGNLLEVHPWIWEHRQEILGTDTKTGSGEQFPRVQDRWMGL